jgi:hypothetical protein
MAANLPEIQITQDLGDMSVVKVCGFFNAATNSNSVIISANTLAFANSVVPCVLTIKSIQYAVGFANGYCQLQWVGNPNTDIVILGGKTSDEFITYMPNQLIANGNTANINGGLSGDIGLSIVGAEPLDAYTLIIHVIKEGGAGGGYKSVYGFYNDNDFGLARQPI